MPSYYYIYFYGRELRDNLDMTNPWRKQATPALSWASFLYNYTHARKSKTMSWETPEHLLADRRRLIGNADFRIYIVYSV